jgi:hypothetical protein
MAAVECENGSSYSRGILKNASIIMAAFAGLLDSEYVVAHGPQPFDHAIAEVLVGIQQGHARQASAFKRIAVSISALCPR